MMVRGRFRPFTLLHNDMLQGAAGQFFCEPEGDVEVDTNVRVHAHQLGVYAAEPGTLPARVHTPAGHAVCHGQQIVQLGLQVSDTYDECVFRDDTLVLLEMTTRDMMEV